MATYAFLFIDDGPSDFHREQHDYQTNPTPEEQAVYGQIFEWLRTNGDKIAHGGAERHPAERALVQRRIATSAGSDEN